MVLLLEDELDEELLDEEDELEEEELPEVELVSLVEDDPLEVLLPEVELVDVSLEPVDGCFFPPPFDGNKLHPLKTNADNVSNNAIRGFFIDFTSPTAFILSTFFLLM